MFHRHSLYMPIHANKNLTLSLPGKKEWICPHLTMRKNYTRWEQSSQMQSCSFEYCRLYLRRPRFHLEISMDAVSQRREVCLSRLRNWIWMSLEWGTTSLFNSRLCSLFGYLPNLFILRQYLFQSNNFSWQFSRRLGVLWCQCLYNCSCCQPIGIWHRLKLGI